MILRRKWATAGIVAFFLGGWIFENGPLLRDIGRSEVGCTPLVRPTFFALPPSTVMGFSFRFKERVPKAFPVGSCSADLLGWLEWQGFSAGAKSSLDAQFADTPEEVARSISRIDRGETILLATMSQKAIMGRSFFSVAWNSDENGRLTEVFADAELFQFDLP